MAEIMMTRVDARLVHGQVAGRWIKTLDVGRVIIIGDEIANDPFMTDLFDLLSPPGTKIICYTIQKAVEEFQKNCFGSGRVMILFKELTAAAEAYKQGFKYESLNIGQVPAGPGRKLAYATVSLSEEELKLLLDLEHSGVRVYFQAIPDDKQHPLDAVAEKMKF